MNSVCCAVLFNGVNVRVRSAQRAGGVFDAITFQRFRAAPRPDARGLLRQVFRRVHDPDFDGNFFSDMLAVLGLFDLPNHVCHACLLTPMIQVYMETTRPASDERHEPG
jgi:hypothetical protein